MGFLGSRETGGPSTPSRCSEGPSEALPQGFISRGSPQSPGCEPWQRHGGSAQAWNIPHQPCDRSTPMHDAWLLGASVKQVRVSKTQLAPKAPSDWHRMNVHEGFSADGDVASPYPPAPCNQLFPVLAETGRR